MRIVEQIRLAVQLPLISRQIGRASRRVKQVLTKKYKAKIKEIAKEMKKEAKEIAKNELKKEIKDEQQLKMALQVFSKTPYHIFVLNDIVDVIR